MLDPSPTFPSLVECQTSSITFSPSVRASSFFIGPSPAHYTCNCQQLPTVPTKVSPLVEIVTLVPPSSTISFVTRRTPTASFSSFSEKLVVSKSTALSTPSSLVRSRSQSSPGLSELAPRCSPPPFSLGTLDLWPTRISRLPMPRTLPCELLDSSFPPLSRIFLKSSRVLTINSSLLERSLPSLRLLLLPSRLITRFALLSSLINTLADSFLAVGSRTWNGLLSYSCRRLALLLTVLSCAGPKTRGFHLVCLSSSFLSCSFVL